MCWKPVSLMTKDSHCAGARFVPRPEERLLLVVHALLHRCYKLPFSNNNAVRHPAVLIMSQDCSTFCASGFAACSHHQQQAGLKTHVLI